MFTVKGPRLKTIMINGKTASFNGKGVLTTNDKELYELACTMGTPQATLKKEEPNKEAPKKVEKKAKAKKEVSTEEKSE